MLETKYITDKVLVTVLVIFVNNISHKYLTSIPQRCHLCPTWVSNITVKIVVSLLLAWLFYFHRFTGRLSMVIIEFLYKRFQKRAYTGLVNSQMNESPVAVWPKRNESETFRNLWRIHVIRIYAMLFIQYGLMQI